jgi:hypothetical protein
MACSTTMEIATNYKNFERKSKQGAMMASKETCSIESIDQ